MEKHTAGQTRRRDFLRTAGAATVLGGLTVLGSRTAKGAPKKVYTAGLVGCGGRGNGAARDIIQAGQVLGIDVRVTALADVFLHKIERCRAGLVKAGQTISKTRCFPGFTGYRKLIDSGVDIVLLATPPGFRPHHFEAVIKAGRHCFFEKPVAVDAAGCARMLEAHKLAQKQSLACVTGTIYRHSPNYLGTHKLIADGAIGRIRGGMICYCTSALWVRPRQPGMTDAQYMANNWGNFAELSGDHVVEQHVHTIDALNWFMGAHPEAATAFGGRHRRRTGNQFDFFSCDYEYPGGVRIHSFARQIRGCWSRTDRHLVGEKGWTNCAGVVELWDGTRLNIPQVKSDHRNPYVQEHVDMLRSILAEKPLDETLNITASTATAILCRDSAYTGKRITWDQMLKESKAYSPGPADFETGNVKAPPDNVVPVPGAQGRRRRRRRPKSQSKKA